MIATINIIDLLIIALPSMIGGESVHDNGDLMLHLSSLQWRLQATSMRVKCQ
jgi:hypothetical protein